MCSIADTACRFNRGLHFHAIDHDGQTRFLQKCVKHQFRTIHVPMIGHKVHFGQLREVVLLQMLCKRACVGFCSQILCEHCCNGHDRMLMRHAFVQLQFCTTFRITYDHERDAFIQSKLDGRRNTTSFDVAAFKKRTAEHDNRCTVTHEFPCV